MRKRKPTRCNFALALLLVAALAGVLRFGLDRSVWQATIKKSLYADASPFTQDSLTTQIPLDKTVHVAESSLAEKSEKIFNLDQSEDTLTTTKQLALATSPTPPSICTLPQDSNTPRVVASIAVHPPKFHYAARFLEQRAACPGALAHLGVYLVFTDTSDLQKFKEMIGHFSPQVVTCLGVWWTPLVANPPTSVTSYPGLTKNQYIAAWKKWFGILHVMDQLADMAPLYGLMLDAELQLYDPADCGLNGRWSELLPRLQAYEDSKQWPAARVAQNLSCYNFAHGKMCGAGYDKALLNIIAKHVTKGKLQNCQTKECSSVQSQIDQVLFSWWTDLPYVNFTKAAKLVAFLTSSVDSSEISRVSLRWTENWRHLARSTTFTRFEHVEYQQWCVLYEGFQFRDVTKITGMASWGSYMEDPQPGARIVDLMPLWVSSNAYVRSQRGTIPDLAPAKPLLIFHVDHSEGFLQLVPPAEHPRILEYKAKFGVP